MGIRSPSLGATSFSSPFCRRVLDWLGSASLGSYRCRDMVVRGEESDINMLEMKAVQSVLNAFLRW